MDDYIDVLLATYNGEKYIRQQIDSILNQTYKKIRIFISDDCSTDDTPNILKKYESEHDNIYVTYQKDNMGSVKNFEFSHNKNTGGAMHPDVQQQGEAAKELTDFLKKEVL